MVLFLFGQKKHDPSSSSPAIYAFFVGHILYLICKDALLYILTIFRDIGEKYDVRGMMSFFILYVCVSQRILFFKPHI